MYKCIYVQQNVYIYLIVYVFPALLILELYLSEMTALSIAQKFNNIKHVF